MQLSLDRTSADPLFRQIAEQIRTAIQTGELSPGSELPSVRGLAKKLRVSSLTAFNAYRTLGNAGFVEARARQATRVAMTLPGSAALDLLGRLPEAGPSGGFERVAGWGGVRSMASAIGDPALFHQDEFLAELAELRRESAWNFYYAEPGGAPELLAQIALLLRRDGIEASESSLLATSGSHAAHALILDTLTRPGDRVLVQEPGRLWLRELIESKGLTAEPIADVDGTLDLERARRRGAKLLVVLPAFGHCTGRRMSLEARQSCVEFARENDLIIVEDGCTAPLSYVGDRIAPVAAIAEDCTVHVGSFSYNLCPGVSTGYLRVPSHLRARFLSASEATARCGVRMMQIALARFIGRGSYDLHLRRVLPRYRARRDALVTALRAYMPASVAWTEPEGGLSAWVTLAATQASSGLYRSALARGVAFAPGSLFLTSDDPDRHLRLSFGMLEPEAIRESVRALAGLIE